jgi:hypothetical protein
MIQTHPQPVSNLAAARRTGSSLGVLSLETIGFPEQARKHSRLTVAMTLRPDVELLYTDHYVGRPDKQQPDFPGLVKA